jgi:hypothetical protein
MGRLQSLQRNNGAAAIWSIDPPPRPVELLGSHRSEWNRGEECLSVDC